MLVGFDIQTTPFIGFSKKKPDSWPYAPRLYCTQGMSWEAPLCTVPDCQDYDTFSRGPFAFHWHPWWGNILSCSYLTFWGCFRGQGSRTTPSGRYRPSKGPQKQMLHLSSNHPFLRTPQNWADTQMIGSKKLISLHCQRRCLNRQLVQHLFHVFGLMCVNKQNSPTWTLNTSGKIFLVRHLQGRFAVRHS